LDRVKEDVEQIDELKKSTLASYVKGAMKDREDRATGASFKSGAAGDKYNKADETEKEVKRGKGIDTALNKLSKEDVGDPQAAIKGVGIPVPSQQESRASKLKSIVKKKMAEDTYDSEKDDKYGANPTFGKKPVMKTVDDKNTKNIDGVKTKAAAVLTGGTTLTGQKRDTVQIDPQLNNPRPGQSDPNGDRSNK
jgi:hypothetical protein